ncbi:MAG: hypothetical protein LBK23_10390 [Oscillospiraceae bacterium]|jgi:hypothetical protein|nr:hypothetical protein [Oscillospiraceae bacterium]
MLSGLGYQMLSTVFALSDFLWLSLAAVVALLVLLFVLTGGEKRGRARLRVLGLLAGLRSPDALWLSQALIRELFIISIVVFHIEMTAPFLAFYGGLFLLGLVTHRRRIAKLAAELVSGVVTAAALVVTNVMWGFLMEVRSDTAILIVYILLSLFIAVYNLYATVKDMGDLFEGA